MDGKGQQPGPAGPGEIGLEPDYWHGQWYNDIKSWVAGAATEMRNHGVDPHLISADDAWAHFSGRVREGQARMIAAGHEIPEEYRMIVQPDSAMSRVFKAMWGMLDLHKLIEGKGPI